MKRLITLVLVLVMALSLAAPAMAFTTLAPTSSDAEPELAIKLVDLSEGFVTVNFNAPPTNRGYVKNEVVCAVVSLQVPAKYEFENEVLQFSGVNVSLWQDDNFYGNGGDAKGGGKGDLRYVSNNVDNTGEEFAYASDMAADNYIQYNGLGDFSDEPAQTYYFAIFGRVLGDNAKMTATLKGTGTLPNAYNSSDQGTSTSVKANDSLQFVKIGDYSIAYFNPNEVRPSAGTSGLASASVVKYATTTNDRATRIELADHEIMYVVRLDKAKGTIQSPYTLAIITDKNFNCQRMYVNSSPADSPASWSRVYDGNKQDASNQADFWGGVYIQFQMEDNQADVVTLVSPATAANHMLFLKEVVYGHFGLDIRGMGNILKPEWWFGNESKTVEVAIEPWYAEVTVPPEIEIEIPKTGDAMSALGFVLIALAGLAVVAVRKVKA